MGAQSQRATQGTLSVTLAATGHARSRVALKREGGFLAKPLPSATLAFRRYCLALLYHLGSPADA